MRFRTLATLIILASPSIVSCRSVAGYASPPDATTRETGRDGMAGDGDRDADGFNGGRSDGAGDLRITADGSADHAMVALDGSQPAKDGQLVAADSTPAVADAGLDSAPLQGQWFSVNMAQCPTFCGTQGMVNGESPEGAKCASGEVRPQSALDAKLVFIHGCWGSCLQATQSAGAASFVLWCYASGQTHDADLTDYTIGCFCK